MSTKITLSIFLMCLLILLVNCSKPAQYGSAYIGMKLDAFYGLHPDAEKIDWAQGVEKKIDLYERYPGGDAGREQYYFKGGKLTGIVVSFAERKEFQTILEELKALNGHPAEEVKVRGSRAAVWEQGGTVMNLMKFAGTPARVNLPAGNADTIAPGGILLFIKRK